jgi:hypothetical protein
MLKVRTAEQNRQRLRLSAVPDLYSVIAQSAAAKSAVPSGVWLELKVA